MPVKGGLQLAMPEKGGLQLAVPGKGGLQLLGVQKILARFGRLSPIRGKGSTPRQKLINPLVEHF